MPALVRAALLALFLFTLALFLPRYAWAFVGDDYVQFGYIRELVETPAAFYRAFNPLWSTWYYRPLQNLWFLANRLAFGLNPFPYYYLQGLWHLLALALCYALARRLPLSRGLALATGALFALNAAHQDVVGWISAVATPMVTVFSFAAILAYLHHCRRSPARSRPLILVLLFTLLALLGHETGVLLPPFLLLLALAGGPRPRREYALLGGLLLLALIFAAVHFLRPNLTLVARGTPAGAYLDPAAFAQFLAVVAGRWSLLTRTAWGTALLNRLLAAPLSLLALALALLLLAWQAFQGGGEQQGALARWRRAALLALAWTALHLLFIYAALWLQAPGLLGGRHLYGAWAGVALALGATVQATLAGPRRRAAKHAAPAGFRLQLALLALLLAGFLGAQLVYEERDEAAWLARAREVAAVEAQMKALLPAVTPETAIYADTFVLKPAFAPYAAAVWYGQSGLEGGSLARLQEAGRLGPDTYLFGYEAGRLHELLPALHDFSATFLLWPDTPAPRVAGPAGAQRLSLAASGEGWQTLAVTSSVPAGTAFYSAFSGPPGSRYRVRARTAGETFTLIPETTAVRPDEWQPLLAPLPLADATEVTFYLEAIPGGGGEAAWALPRLVAGPI